MLTSEFSPPSVRYPAITAQRSLPSNRYPAIAVQQSQPSNRSPAIAAQHSQPSIRSPAFAPPLSLGEQPKAIEHLACGEGFAETSSGTRHQSSDRRRRSHRLPEPFGLQRFHC